jgi:hypothetical protein
VKAGLTNRRYDMRAMTAQVSSGFNESSAVNQYSVGAERLRTGPYALFEAERHLDLGVGGYGDTVAESRPVAPLLNRPLRRVAEARMG